MNVRFFAGTRAQYDALAAPHNPQALYFCSDTNELFWGDRLLTDGMRVVPTYADLPTPDKAADGVVYYVAETRNGYVVPHGGAEWLQTIYAPLKKGEAVVPGEEDNTVTTVGAVNDIVEQIYKDMDERCANIEIGEDPSVIKAIKFAGFELEEVDGAFVIDRRCAREALGFIVPEDLENKAIELATKADIPSIDGLATEAFVRNAIAEAELSDKDVDISGLVTKDEIKNLASISYVDEKVAGIEIPEVPTKVSAFTNDAGYITEHQDLSEYATKQFVSKIAITQKYEVLPVDGMLISYRDGEVRLNTQRVIPTLQNVGETGNANMYYVTFRAFAPEGATKVIEGLNGKLDEEFSSLATDSYGRKYITIWSAIASTPDGGNTWTKWGDSSTLDKYLGFYYHFHWYNEDTLISTDKVRVILTNDECHDDLVPDAVARRIDEKVANIEVPEIDLSDYALKTDIPDVSNFTTMEEVEAKGYLTEHQSLDEYAKKDELFNKDYNELINKPEIPSVDGLASVEYVDVKFNAIDIPEVDLTGYATEDFVKNAIAEAELNDKDVDLSGFATEEYVNAAIAAIEHPTVNLENYVTKDEIEGLIREIPSEYITEEELEAKGYITNVDDKADINHVHENYADKEHVHTEYLTADDITGKADTDHNHDEVYAAKEHEHEQYLTEHQSLDNYYTKSEADTKVNRAVAAKANSVLFTTDKYVTKALGGFAIDDNLNGLTIAQILAKLLELSDTKVNPPESGDDDETLGVIETIIANKTPMYSITADGQLAAVPYKYLAYTEETGAVAPTESGFYQISSADGTILESGYQELQVESGDVYYVIALPNGVDYVNDVTVKAWDSLNNAWVDTGAYKPDLTSDPDAVAEVLGEMETDVSHINTEEYTIWVQTDTPSGRKLRFIINQ